MFVFRRSFLGLLSVALAVTACSQVPEATLPTERDTLTPQFGTSAEDRGKSVLVSRPTNAVYAVSSSVRFYQDSGTKSETDAFLRRYNPDGTLAWRKTFNATPYEDLTNLSEDAQGNVVVGLTEIDRSGASTAELIKYAPTGRELRRFPLVGVQVAYSVAAAPTGDIFVVGSGTDYRPVIHKYDRDGTLRWTKRLPHVQSFGFPTATDSAGNFYLYIDDYTETLVKLDPTGKVVWTKAVPAGTADRVQITDLTVVRDSLLFTGYKIWILKDTETEYEDETDALVASYSLNGTQNWQRSFGTKEGDWAASIASDSAPNLYVSTYLGNDATFVVRKYTLAGRLLKETATARNLDQRGDYISDMAVYRDDEVYLTGDTTRDLGAGYAGGFTDAFLMRVDGQGKQVWVR